MSQNHTISFSLVLKDGANGLKTLTMEAKDLRTVLDATVDEAKKLNEKFINFAAICTGIDSVNNTLSSAQDILKGFTKAYSDQIEAETKLATVMRETIGATEAEIQSIKDLCSAQQELGVIGDEVQLSGAQKLATFLSEKQSLEQLIPVMNDVLAQQYGLNATQENAAQVAALLGKAMTGQAGALKRYGFSFNEAQEHILEFGTETQKSAILCEVITSKVGGMNAELAKTDVGKQKQLDNTIGDIKEKLGGLVQGAMPFITIAANSGIALTGVLKLVLGIKGATVAVSGFITKHNLLKTTMKSVTSGVSKMTRALRIYSTAAQGSAASSIALKVALRGLLITTGVGIAIASVTAVIAHFVSATDDATESIEDNSKEFDNWKRSLTDIAGAAQQEMAKELTALERLYKAATDETRSRQERLKAANELKTTYADTFRNLKTEAILAGEASKAYDELRKSIIQAATAKAASAKIEQNQGEWLDLEMEKETINMRIKNRAPELAYFQKMEKDLWDETLNDKAEIGTTDKNAQQRAERRAFMLKGAQATVKSLNEENTNDTTRLAEIEERQTVIGKANDTLEQYTHYKPHSTLSPTTTPTNSEPTYKADAANIDEYKANISALEKERAALGTDSLERAAEINHEIISWQEKIDAVLNAGAKTDVDIHADPKSLKEVNENLKLLHDRLERADTDTDRADINSQIDAQEKLAQSYREAGKSVEESTLKMNPNAKTLKEIGDNITYLQDELLKASTVDEAASLNQQINAWTKKADAIRRAGEESRSTFEIMRDGWGSIKGIGSGVESITAALEGNGNAWQTVTSIVDGFLQIYDGIQKVVGIVKELTDAMAVQTVITEADAAAQTADATATAENTTEAITNTAAKSGEAIADATASGAKLPFPYNLIAIASGVAAVVSALAIVGSFATGGIVGGNSPTGDKLLARVNSGEMILNKEQQSRLFALLAGGVKPFANGSVMNTPAVRLIGHNTVASHNPEMETSLDRLCGMLKPTGEPVIIGGTIRASGRDLVCALANETRIASKSGKRTNIKL